MEISFLQIWEGGWIGAILRGATITIAIGLCSMVLGGVIGTLCGLIKWGRIFPLNLLVDAYTSVVRGIPELLIIYLLFFSSVEFVSKLASAFGYAGMAAGGYAFIIAVIAIGTISGAYTTEVVRGALNSIPKGHLEAASALGIGRARIFRRIILPQMLRIAYPGMNNVWQITIKDTALVSVVGLQELMRVAFIGAGSTRSPFIFYLTAAATYFLITIISQAGLVRFERRLIFSLRRA
ncbi:ABC transporter permease subunit [Ochrobactrum sp. WV_118_8]|uniref:ABC transporter permease subunit n=1 Tax=Brucella tritici TaxID=94626 RepID=A0A7V7VQC8_9HYPH|nr:MULTISPECIES: ABC transporter permease subunit [Brucella/Ochrobactrum group]KAB2654617.1 ABC transporter permease subunit [Brucella tritici]KAB2755661.1 ABC transporter permease subunit [Brucella anthropi]KAB2773752.1 ABC transporter permease subunit [Brucella anthropi]MCQ9148252.1 ABC transporter permease subunit [Ochrobactrum sp. BTU2]MCR8494117.1 ABC transporter permease subunit [Brucella anthropi]